MTAIISLFGIVGRFAGDLINSATGWAGSLMFGRVPQSHRRYLTAMLGGSVLWIVLVIGFLVPGLLSWGLQTTPHPSFITSSWLAVVITLGVILVPLGVGAAAWLAPADAKRAKGIRGTVEPLRGYILAPAIGGLLLFLDGVGIVRKARSARHRWTDTHIPIVVPPKGYDDTVSTLQVALADAGFPLRPQAASPLLSLPAWVITHLAAPNIRRQRPDRIIELRGDDIRVGIYPSDVAVSTTAELRTSIRAAILAAMAGADAHLTTSAEAQAVEDRLKAISAGGPDRRGLWRQGPELAALARSLLTLDVPNDEWDVLYRLRRQAERDLLRRALGERAAADVPLLDTPIRASSGERVDDVDGRREGQIAQVPAL